MKTINKAQAYSDLKYIKEHFNVDTLKYVKEVAENDGIIPPSTIIFINKYKPLEQFYTYNKVYENRKKNPLYKNLVNENLDVEERAIALSSFVTQVMIHNKELMKENKKQDSKEFLELMNVNTILEALNDYSIGNEKKLNESFDMVRDVFKNLYSK